MDNKTRLRMFSLRLQWFALGFSTAALFVSLLTLGLTLLEPK